MGVGGEMSRACKTWQRLVIQTKPVSIEGMTGKHRRIFASPYYVDGDDLSEHAAMIELGKIMLYNNIHFESIDQMKVDYPFQ